MQTAEFNHEDFSDAAEADKSLLVRFFYKNVQNKLESQQLGRPVFKEKTYIEIRVAGQRDVQACRPVTYADKQRFPRHYEAFEKRVEPPTEGMPLIEFPAITRTQAEELSFMNVKTVEQLASMKDANLSKFMNGYKLRDQAVKWLESNTLAVDDAEKNELKSSVFELQEQVNDLLHGVNGRIAVGDAEKEELNTEIDALREINKNLLTRLTTGDAEKTELKATAADMKVQIAQLTHILDLATFKAKGAGNLDLEATKNLSELGVKTDVAAQLTSEEMPELKSTLDETPIEGAAIKVPAAPAGVPKRKSRRATK
jgi:hypothetical protein